MPTVLRPNQPVPQLSRAPRLSPQRQAVTGRAQTVAAPVAPMVRAPQPEPVPVRAATPAMGPQQSVDWGGEPQAQTQPQAQTTARNALQQPTGAVQAGRVSTWDGGMNDVGAQQAAMEQAAQTPAGPPSGVGAMTKDPQAMAAAKHAAAGALRGGLKTATQVAGIPGAATGDLINAGVMGAGMGAVGGLVNYGIDRGIGWGINQVQGMRAGSRVAEVADQTDFSQPSQVQALAENQAEERARLAAAPNTALGYLEQWGGSMFGLNDEDPQAYQTTSAALNLNQEPSFAQSRTNKSIAYMENEAGLPAYSLGRIDPNPTLGGRVTTPGAAFGNPGDGISRGGFGDQQGGFDNGVEAGTGYTTGYVAGQPAQRFGPPQTPKAKPAKSSQPTGSISGSGRIGSQPGGGYGAGPSGSRFGIGGQGNNDIGGSGRIGSQPGGEYGFGGGGFGGFGGGGSGGGGASVGGQGGAGIASDSESGGHGW